MLKCSFKKELFFLEIEKQLAEQRYYLVNNKYKQAHKDTSTGTHALNSSISGHLYENQLNMKIPLYR